MKEQLIRDIVLWMSEEGIRGLKEQDLLAGFCDRCHAAGLPIDRALGIIDTLHPEFEGRAFQWNSDSDEVPEVVQYGSTSGGEAQANWQRSVFFYMPMATRSFQQTTAVGFCGRERRCTAASKPPCLERGPGMRKSGSTSIFALRSALT